MADISKTPPPQPVGQGGGQDGGGFYTRFRRSESDDEEKEEDAGTGGQDRNAFASDEADGIDLATGLEDVVSDKAPSLIDRLTKQLSPLEAERDALRTEVKQLRHHAETVTSFGVHSDYGLKTALARVLSNRRHLSGVPGMILVSVQGLEAIAIERGQSIWGLAVRHALAIVRRTSHSTDTVGILGSGQIAVITLVGDHDALEKLGRNITAAFAMSPYEDGTKPWPLNASFGGVELHNGATVDAAFAEAEAARLVASGPNDPASVVVSGDASAAVARYTEPTVPDIPDEVLSDEDMDRVQILGVIDPGGVPSLPPEPEPKEGLSKDQLGNDVGK